MNLNAYFRVGCSIVSTGSGKGTFFSRLFRDYFGLFCFLEQESVPVNPFM